MRYSLGRKNESDQYTMEKTGNPTTTLRTFDEV